MGKRAVEVPELAKSGDDEDEEERVGEEGMEEERWMSREKCRNGLGRENSEAAEAGTQQDVDQHVARRVAELREDCEAERDAGARRRERKSSVSASSDESARVRGAHTTLE